MTRRTLLLTALAAAAALSSFNAAWAQGRPIRLVVPYAAGGPLDVTARVLAERVKDSLGPIIVDNKPGAGGNIGADAVAKATPDGLTIGIAATATHAVNPWLYAKMPYNAATDFAPITQMVRVPNVLVMNAEAAQRLKINSVKDLIAYAKANPAKLNYGSGGNGSAGHLAGEMFKSQAGIFAVHIPYNGGNPAQFALQSGQVDFNFDNLATAAPGIKSGQLKALGERVKSTLESDPQGRLVLIGGVTMPTLRDLSSRDLPKVKGQTVPAERILVSPALLQEFGQSKVEFLPQANKATTQVLQLQR